MRSSFALDHRDLQPPNPQTAVDVKEIPKWWFLCISFPAPENCPIEVRSHSAWKWANSLLTRSHWIGKILTIEMFNYSTFMIVFLQTQNLISLVMLDKELSKRFFSSNYFSLFTLWFISVYVAEPRRVYVIFVVEIKILLIAGEKIFAN